VRLFAGIFPACESASNFLSRNHSIVRTVNFGENVACREASIQFPKVDNLSVPDSESTIFSAALLDKWRSRTLLLNATLEGGFMGIVGFYIVPILGGSLGLVLVTSTFDRQSVVTVTASH